MHPDMTVQIFTQHSVHESCLALAIFLGQRNALTDAGIFRHGIHVAKLVKAHHGKGGGYKLNRAPSEYPLSEILATTEISIAPVSCLKDDEDPCPKEATCSTIHMWKELYSVTKGYLDSVTLEDLKQKEIELNGE